MTRKQLQLTVLCLLRDIIDLETIGDVAALWAEWGFKVILVCDDRVGSYRRACARFRKLKQQRKIEIHRLNCEEGDLTWDGVESVLKICPNPDLFYTSTASDWALPIAQVIEMLSESSPVTLSDYRRSLVRLNTADLPVAARVSYKELIKQHQLQDIFIQYLRDKVVQYRFLRRYPLARRLKKTLTVVMMESEDLRAQLWRGMKQVHFIQPSEMSTHDLPQNHVHNRQPPFVDRVVKMAQDPDLRLKIRGGLKIPVDKRVVFAPAPKFAVNQFLGVILAAEFTLKLRNITVLVNIHPSAPDEERKTLDRIAANYDFIQVVESEEATSDELIAASDVVLIPMFSSMIRIASILGATPVIDATFWARVVYGLMFPMISIGKHPLVKGLLALYISEQEEFERLLSKVFSKRWAVHEEGLLQVPIPEYEGVATKEVALLVGDLLVLHRQGLLT